MTPSYRLGNLALRPETQRLEDGARSVRLTRKAIDVLVALGQAGPTGLTRDQLMSSVWRDVVVDDAVLKQYVYKLRAAFRELDPEREYIETVPYQGYRLTVTFTEEEPATQRVEEGATSNAPVPAPTPPLSVRPTSDRRFRWWRTAAAFVVVGVVVSGAVVITARMRTADRAHELVSDGFALMRRSNFPSIGEATALFDRALQLQPGLPIALAGLAEAYSRGSNTEFDHARRLASDAVGLDEACAECQGVLGYVLMTRHWDWVGADRALARGLALDPDNVQIRAWRAQWQIAAGQPGEAVKTAEAAAQIDPTRAGTFSTLASAYYFAGRPRDAIRAADKALGLQPSFQPAFKWRYRAHLLIGDDFEAVKNRAQDVSAWQAAPEVEVVKRMQAFSASLVESGRRHVITSWLDGTSMGRAVGVQRYERAVWRMAIDDATGAIVELEAAVASRPYDLMYVDAEPFFAPLRDDARFRKVVETVRSGVSGTASAR